MDYEKLKEVIAKQIKENGRGEITGPVLQAVLMAMVDSLGEVYPQTYTDEQKAQARANIDALSNYDGEITKEKLSAEVQAILDDVANKQNITDENLATIAKTIVGAINEVYKGGLEDGSIATSKIEDNAITEAKLDTALTAKVNNNVKVVEQTLTDAEIGIASKNLKFRDDNDNFFVDKVSYDSVSSLSIKPYNSTFGTGCTRNIFGESCIYLKFGNLCSGNTIRSSCDYNMFGNHCSSNLISNYSQGNTFGNSCENNELGVYCQGNTFGDSCKKNILGEYCRGNMIGNFCYANDFGACLVSSKIDNGVAFIQLKSNATPNKSAVANIHILSGVCGISETKKLVINIPDEYLNSSRELIITTKTTSKGASTPEDLVMYYADEVVDKQNKQDSALETTSKEVVGAINELFNGGVKDKSIDASKLAQAVQDTLGMIGTNVKVLSSGTDLKAVTKAGVYILSGLKDYLNSPNNWEHYNTAILIVSGDGGDYNNGKTIIGFQNGSRYPFAATLRNNEWTETDLDTALKGKLDNTSTLSDTEVNNIWDNN